MSETYFKISDTVGKITNEKAISEVEEVTLNDLIKRKAKIQKRVDEANVTLTAYTALIKKLDLQIAELKKLGVKEETGLLNVTK